MSLLSRSSESDPQPSAPPNGPSVGGPPALSCEQLLVAVEVDERGVPRPLDNPTAFKIVRPLGEGGMGVVYLALQTYPERMVALKVLKTSGRQDSMRRRFAREISALARLQHRGIAQLLSAGNVQTTLGVQPYLTMEYIEGIPLTDYALRQGLTTDDRLRLFLKVCDAVTHAHRRGIIHRDLSPKNILVTDDSEPHVLDFGLASLREDAARSGATTMDGQILGTLQYMSPEQARGAGGGAGEGHASDERTDVYALGVILFELLTGRRPILREHSTVLEALERLQNEAPLRASSLDRRFRGDIDTIAQKAIARDRARRYASVEALAADLVRYLQHEPILAQPPSAAYRARKFVQRHKVMVSATAAVILALLLGLVAATREAQRANRQARETALKLADAQVAQADTLLLMERRDEARDLYNNAWDAYERLGVPTLAAQLGVWDVDRRSWHRIATLPMFAAGAADASYSPALSPDGLLIAATDGQGHLMVRAVVDWHVVLAADCPRNSQHVAISNDSRLCAVRGRNNEVVVWDLRSGKIVREAAAEAEASSSFAVAVSGQDGFLAIVDGASGEVLWGRLAGSQPLARIDGSRGMTTIAFDKSGELVMLSSNGRLARFSPADQSWREIRPANPGSRTQLALAPDAATALVANKTQLTLVDSRTGDALRTFPLEAADRAAFFGNSHLATDQTTPPRFYDLEGHFLNRLPGNLQNWSVAGALAARSTEHGAIELWSIADHVGITPMQARPEGQCSCQLSADGRIAVFTSDRMLYALDAETGLVLRRIQLAGPALDIRISSDVLHVYAALGDGSVEAWDVRDGTLRHIATELENPVEAAFDQAGRFIVWGGGPPEHPQGIVVNLQDGTRRTLHGIGQEINRGAVSADGTRLAAGTLSGELVVYDLAHDGKVLWRTTIGQDDAQVAPVFCMNDRYVVAGHNGQELCVFDAATGNLCRAIVRSGAPLVRLRPAGPSGVLAYDRRNLTVYDLHDFRRIRLLETGGDLNDAFAATPLLSHVLLLNASKPGRAVVYDFAHAADTRALEISQKTSRLAAPPAAVDLLEPFALYRLDPQLAAGLAGAAPAAPSNAQTIARRRLGLPAAPAPSAADPDLLPGTKILLTPAGHAVTAAAARN